MRRMAMAAIPIFCWTFCVQMGAVGCATGDSESNSNTNHAWPDAGSGADAALYSDAGSDPDAQIQAGDASTDAATDGSLDAQVNPICDDLTGDWQVTSHCIADYVGEVFSVSQTSCDYTTTDPLDSTVYSGIVAADGSVTLTDGSLVDCTGTVSGTVLTLKCMLGPTPWTEELQRM